jgi:nucleoside-diphosphate-sugar epimerase
MPFWMRAQLTKRDLLISRWGAELRQFDGIFLLLTHLNSVPELPQRTVVIGAGGFVGGAVVARLRHQRANVLAVGRQDVDLLASNAVEKLSTLLRPDDAVVAAAARAPCKDMAMLIDNMIMTKVMLAAITTVDVSHVINISSDAVYPDEPLPLTEKTPAAPTTFHGVMHLAREIAFSSEIKAPLTILRPSLLYGAEDPHNGYGPNRFRRQANAGENIILFGNGEERRDHVLIDDVADLVTRVLARRSRGILNIATGTVHSFRAIAEIAVKLAPHRVSISSRPRQGPMPHNGYRPFDIAAARAAFSDFAYTPLFEGMAKAQRAVVNV